MINNRRGVYLGPTATHKNFWYWPVTTNNPLSARHGVFDEMRYGPGDDSPNSTIIRERLGYLPKKNPTAEKMATMGTDMRGIDIVTSTTPFVEIFEINLPKGCGV